MLPSVTMQKKIMLYFWVGFTYTAISPTFTYDVARQHNRKSIILSVTSYCVTFMPAKIHNVIHVTNVEAGLP